MSTTSLIPLDSNSETLLGILHASKEWETLISYGAGEYWATTFYRTEGPFKGYKLDVPQHDEDPEWLRAVAAVVTGIEHGRMPACGLSKAGLIEAAEVIRQICEPGRDGMATSSEIGTLLGVTDSWYGASPETLATIGAIRRGKSLQDLDDWARLRLRGFASYLTTLLEEYDDPISYHPVILVGEVRTETSLDCCYGQHYDNPGTAYLHDRCGRLVRPWGDVHDHELCVCYGPAEPWMLPAPDAQMVVTGI